MHGAHPPLLLEFDVSPPSEPGPFALPVPAPPELPVPELVELPVPAPPELPVPELVELPFPAPELLAEPEPPLLMDPVAIVPEEPDAELPALASGDPEPTTPAVPPPSRVASAWGATPTMASHPEIMSPHMQASAGRDSITTLLSTARRSGRDPVVPRPHRSAR
jgi:hypothetical protein